MDGDLLPDYATTVYDAGLPTALQQIEVRSSVTHQPIWTATIPNAWANFYGHAIAGGMDLDGDGLADVVASATRLSPGGTIIAYDHFGAELYRIVDASPNWLVGVDLESLGGDLNGDGRDDFLSVGPSAIGSGAVVVFSGADGAVLQVSYGIPPGGLSNGAGCGDLDGDGVLDYAAGGFWGASVVTTFRGRPGCRSTRRAIPSTRTWARTCRVASTSTRTGSTT
jgi:hypothetical protein